MGRIIVVTGGARSGKSAFAERYAQSLPGDHGYIATAQALDEEMAARIAAHRSRRPAAWRTWEIPSGLPEQMDIVLQQCDVVLIDCVTLYISNFLLAQTDPAEGERMVLDDMAAVVAAIRRQPGRTVIFVTNELGCGIVPMEKLSRLYRDLVGRVNQYLAAEAEEVYLTVCGMAVEIKRQQVNLPERDKS